MRVVYGGRQDDGFTASGFYGFPARLLSPAPTLGQGTNFPFATTLKRAVEYYWRPSLWSLRLQGSGTATYLVAGVAENVSFSFNVSLPLAGPVDENALWSAGVAGITFTGSSANAGSVTVGSVVDNLACSASLVLGQVGVVQDGANTWLSTRIAFSFNSALTGFAFGGNSLAAAPGVDATLFFRCFTLSAPVTIRIPGVDTFSLSQATLSPLEYWSYAALDNTPIYNSATGARLQPPTA